MTKLLISVDGQEPREMTDEEFAGVSDVYGNPDIQAQVVRGKRDSRLAETDWWVLPDRTPTQEQIEYRAALRDITQQSGFPHDVVWPTKPEV